MSDLSRFREVSVSGNDDVILMVAKYAKDVQKIQREDLNIIDVEKTMHDLNRVGDLLMVADKTSDGFHVNVAIKGLLAKYQILLRDCVSEMTHFTNTTKYALEKHVDAVSLIDADEFGEALKLISDCIEYATDLAKRSDKLEQQSEEMVANSNSALDEASRQDVKNQELKNEIEKLKLEQKAEKADSDARAKDLAAAVREYRAREDQAIKRAEKESDKAFKVAIAGAVANAIGGILTTAITAGMAAGVPGGGAIMAGAVLNPRVEDGKEKVNKLKGEASAAKNKVAEINKQIEEAEENQEPKETIENLTNNLNHSKGVLNAANEALNGCEKSLNNIVDSLTANASAAEANAQRYGELLREKRDQEIENNARLAKLACEIANSDIELGEVRTAIKMIKLTIRALGNITTTFNNTKLFWNQQKEAFHSLISKGEQTEDFLTKYHEREKSIFLKLCKKGIYDSGMKWLTLFKINHTASVAIRDVYANINDIMRNLGGLESKEEIIKEASKILDQLAEEMKTEAAAITNS